MALASAYGLQYSAPQYGASGQSQAAGTTNPADPSQNYGQENLLSDQLYVKEGMTDEYYKKVAALKSFANEVSSRYGFDVTRPNYRNQDSIRYHRAYLQSLADLQGTQNRLKRLGAQENLSLQSPDISMKTGDDGQDYAVNTGANDIVSTMAAAAKEVKNPEEAGLFNTGKEALISELTDRMDSSQNARERDQLKSTIGYLNQVNPNVGISLAQQAQLDLQTQGQENSERWNAANYGLNKERLDLSRQELSTKAANALGGSDPFGGMTPTNASLIKGRLAIIAQMMTEDGLKERGFEIVNKTNGTFLEKTKNGKKESVRISAKDPLATFSEINDMMNRLGEGANVSNDLINSTSLNIQGAGEQMIRSINPVEDKFPEFEKGFEGAFKDSGLKKAGMKSLSGALESSGSKIPDSLLGSFGANADKSGAIGKVEYSSDWLGNGGSITITSKKSGTGSAGKRIFDLGNPKDLADLKILFSQNKSEINLPAEFWTPSGTDVASGSAGASIISFDEM